MTEKVQDMQMQQDDPDPSHVMAALSEQESGTVKIIPPRVERDANDRAGKSRGNGIISRLRKVLRRGTRNDLQETLDTFVEDESGALISAHEHALITNVLKLRDVRAQNVMVPRTDIVAVDVSTPPEEVCQLMAEKQHSRICVYRDTLDDIIGTIHIKDLLSKLANKEDFQINELCRSIPIVSPAMPVLELLLQMRETKKHMVLVIDEYGGIDGLIAIGDIIEDIVGNIDDEYDGNDVPEIIENSDGSLVADAMVELSDFEEKYGAIFTESDIEDANTLSGLVSSIAGRVPVRGEIIQHESGMEFEVLDADLRRVNRLRIKNIPS